MTRSARLFYQRNGPWTGVVALSADESLAARLDAGLIPDEALVRRALRSPRTSSDLLQRLSEFGWVVRDRRLVTLLVMHPHCPLELWSPLLHHLGWHDLLWVARSPRTPPAVQRQAERLVCHRLHTLAAGEKVALARQGTRTVIVAMFDEGNPRVMQSLLDNPRCVESDVLRILSRHPAAEIVAVVLGHPRWGSRPAVQLAVLRSRNAPLGLALGVLAAQSTSAVRRLLESGELMEGVQRAALSLVTQRRHTGGAGSVRAPNPLASAESPPTLDSQ